MSQTYPFFPVSAVALPATWSLKAKTWCHPKLVCKLHIQALTWFLLLSAFLLWSNSCLHLGTLTVIPAAPLSSEPLHLHLLLVGKSSLVSLASFLTLPLQPSPNIFLVMIRPCSEVMQQVFSEFCFRSGSGCSVSLIVHLVHLTGSRLNWHLQVDQLLVSYSVGFGQTDSISFSFTVRF